MFGILTLIRQRSRPLFGVSIFLLAFDYSVTGGRAFSSPFRGFYLSTVMRSTVVRMISSSRPLFGVSIFLRKKKLWEESTMFSSPFRGFYLSTLFYRAIKRFEQFSSPFRGFYLSTLPSTSLAISVFITYFAA